MREIRNLRILGYSTVGLGVLFVLAAVVSMFAFPELSTQMINQLSSFLFVAIVLIFVSSVCATAASAFERMESRLQHLESQNPAD